MRYKLILFVFILFWAGMIARLYHVSIKSNFYYEELAKENIERKQFIKPVRGEITDNHGHLLAMNQIGFSISIKPHLKSKSKKLNEVVDRLVLKFPDLNKTMMMKVYKSKNSPYNHHYIKVVDFIHYSEMMGAYSQLNIYNEIKIDAETKRYYPYGKYAAHIIGYTGKANTKEAQSDLVVKKIGKIGKTGLEKYYNSLLEGELGYEISKVTATNKAIAILEKKLPKDNKNLELNMDIELQQMIYERFHEHNQTGVAVVMRTNGDILSAVSYPAYDPNLFVGGISFKDWKILQNDLARPFTNKLIHGTYPPGSTIKMGMALAYEENQPNILASNEHCAGFITLGKSKHKFRCWSRWGHGKVNLRRAIRESCDVYFYNKSLKVGINAMAKSLRSFGLGIKTGIDLPREYNGIIPDKAWKMKRYKQPWYMGETVISAIGQGYDSVTPLQIARYTSMVATQKLVTPSIVKNADHNRSRRKTILKSFTPSYLKEIQNGMFDVCNVKGGTAYRTMHKLPIKVAGKTGTSQVTAIPQSTKKRLKEHELAYYHRSHALITTYAPFENPQYIVTVLVEHGGHGGSTAGPIAAKIYKWLYKKGYFIQADENKTTDNNSTLTTR